jgi:hypothetical protein
MVALYHPAEVPALCNPVNVLAYKEVKSAIKRKQGEDKMARFVRVVGLIVALSLLAGCTFNMGDMITGSGQTTTKNYDLSGFTKVNIGSAFQATVTQSEAYGVSVTVDDNLVQYLDVRMDGDTLVVGFKPNLRLGFRNTTLKATITLPELVGFTGSGATRTQLRGFKTSKAASVEASGASQVRGDIATTGSMKVGASGASTVELSGSSAGLSVDASGASTVKLDNFTASDASVNASGASNITVNATGKVTGEASGASSVHYTGNPASVKVSTSGASNVGQK